MYVRAMDACNQSICSVFSEIVVICVNLSAEFGSLQQTLPTYLIIAVVRDVQLIEAGVGQGIAFLIEIGHQTDLVLP